MQDILHALNEQFDELAHLVEGLDEVGWNCPSGCEGWTLADVMLHLAQTNDLAIASAEGRFDAVVEEFANRAFPGRRRAVSIDGAADLQVQRERGRSGAEVFERWTATTVRLLHALGASDPHDRVHWVARDLSVRTLATTRLAETWIHTDDIASGLAVVLAPTSRLRHIARLAWRTIPYAFDLAGTQLSGPVAFDLTGPNGEPWRFGAENSAVTIISGDAHQLCLVAARRIAASDTQLRGTGPDAERVLELVRTYA